jgi:hypothetical protein
LGLAVPQLLDFTCHVQRKLFGRELLRVIVPSD